MTRNIRQILLILSTAGLAMPAHAVSQTVTVKASVVKPLTLTAVQGLDLGTFTLQPGTWSNAVVGISKTGTFTCNANVTCTGAPQVAQFTVSGTNNQTVKVTAPNVTLVNQADSSQTLVLTVDAPATIALPNSGTKGVDFNIGGTLTLSSTTADGNYSGILNVTVDYQ
jgi:Domain of unknown function (DUF4402)